MHIAASIALSALLLTLGLGAQGQGQGLTEGAAQSAQPGNLGAQVTVTNTTQLVQAFNNPGVTSILINACYLYMPSSVWGHTAPILRRRVTVKRHPDTVGGCRPIIDFNYAYGIFNITMGGRLTFEELLLSKIQRVVPMALAHAPAAPADPMAPPDAGEIVFIRCVLHNELTAPLQAAIMFFNSVARPEQFPGKQTVPPIEGGWCDPGSMVAGAGESRKTWINPNNASDPAMPAFLPPGFNIGNIPKQGTAGGIPSGPPMGELAPGGATGTDVQGPPPMGGMGLPAAVKTLRFARRLLGRATDSSADQQASIASTSAKPYDTPTEQRIYSNITNGRPCWLWAIHAKDFSSKPPVTADNVGGIAEHWVDTIYAANVWFPVECFTSGTTPTCIRDYQAKITGDMPDLPTPLKAEVQKAVQAAAHRAGSSSSSSNTTLGLVLGLVLGGIAVIAFSIVLRIRWMAIHSPEVFEGIRLLKWAPTVFAQHSDNSESSLDQPGGGNDKGKRLQALSNAMMTTARSITHLLGRAPGGIRLSHIIGAGSFGRVYAGVWRGQPVAVKIILHTPADTKRVAAELAVCSSLDHPNIVKYYFHETITSSSSQPFTEKVKDAQASTTTTSTTPSTTTGSSSNSSAPCVAAATINIPKQFAKASAPPVIDTNDLAADGLVPLPETTITPVLFLKSASDTDDMRDTTSDQNTASCATVPVSTGTASTGPTTSSGTHTSAAVSAGTDDHLAGVKTSETWICSELCLGSMATAARAGVFNNPNGTPNLVSILRVARDVAAGMCHVHAKGIIHGDLKADNVLLAEVAAGAAAGATPPSATATSTASSPQQQLVAKITDFGMARVMGADHTHMSTCACGTITHCAPEYLQQGHLSPAADVYAFGVLLYELAVGRPAWQGKLHGEVVHRVINGQRPDFPHHTAAAIPDEYVDLARSCWAATPQDRPTFPAVVDTVDMLLAAWGTGVVPCAALATPALLPCTMKLESIIEATSSVAASGKGRTERDSGSGSAAQNVVQHGSNDAAGISSVKP